MPGNRAPWDLAVELIDIEDWCFAGVRWIKENSPEELSDYVKQMLVTDEKTSGMIYTMKSFKIEEYVLLSGGALQSIERKVNYDLVKNLKLGQEPYYFGA